MSHIKVGVFTREDAEYLKVQIQGRTERKAQYNEITAKLCAKMWAVEERRGYSHA